MSGRKELRQREAPRWPQQPRSRRPNSADTSGSRQSALGATCACILVRLSAGTHHLTCRALRPVDLVASIHCTSVVAAPHPTTDHVPFPISDWSRQIHVRKDAPTLAPWTIRGSRTVIE